MKFCSKCGGQMEDHAAFCPNCGAPAANTAAKPQQPEKEHRSKLTTGLILNNIAGFINLIFIAFFTYSILFLYDNENTPAPPPKEAGIQITYNYEAPQPNAGWFALWVVLLITLFVLGILLGKKKLKKHTLFSYIYLALSILSSIVLLFAFPELKLLLLCAIGFLIFVPAILQIIAGVKFLQGGAQ